MRSFLQYFTTYNLPSRREVRQALLLIALAMALAFLL